MNETKIKRRGLTFRRLRYWLMEHDYITEDLCDVLLRSPAYVQRRMSGAQEWSRADMYEILSWMKKPAEELPLYFPKDIFEAVTI